MAAAGKRADRAATEGLVGVIVDPGVASIVGIGCETEPVSGNEAFQAFGENVLRAVHADGPSAVDAFEAERAELIAQLGENIVVVSAERLEGGTLAAYVHPPANKIGVVVRLEGGSEARPPGGDAHLVRRPAYTSREDVPEDVVAAERRSISTRTRWPPSRSRHVRRSSTACSASASSQRRPAAPSSSRRGSTTPRRRLRRRSTRRARR